MVSITIQANALRDSPFNTNLQCPHDKILASLVPRWADPVAYEETNPAHYQSIPECIGLVLVDDRANVFPHLLEYIHSDCPATDQDAIC